MKEFMALARIAADVVVSPAYPLEGDLGGMEAADAEAFTGLKGVLVPIEDTIKGFNMIMDGEVDDLPEAAFHLVGTIEEAKEKGKKILAEAK